MEWIGLIGPMGEVSGSMIMMRCGMSGGLLYV